MTASGSARAVARLGARQHGHVTTRQLQALGWQRWTIATKIDQGLLIPRHRGVYAVGHSPRTREARWMAAVLSAGSHGVLSHRAAAALWGIVDGAVVTDITVPPRAGHRVRLSATVHRSAIPPEHITRRDGIPVTTLVRTLLDLASVYRLPRLARAFENAQVRHGMPPEPLAAEVISRRGYRGNARLRTILAGAVDPESVRSILELRFLRLCSAHDIDRPLVNHELGRWTVDFLWPKRRLVVETDGVRFHRTAAQRTRDRERDEGLCAEGFRVLRLQWADVVERPAATATGIRAALQPSPTP